MLHKFFVKNSDIGYVAHQYRIGTRDRWCWSFLGKDGRLHHTLVALDEADAIAKASKAAATYGQWPEGQRCIEWVRPPSKGRI